MKFFKKLNEKSKKLAKKFFIETKFGIWLMASMAMLNAVEGIIHLIVALIGGYGAVDINVYDFRVWMPIIENFILGIFSILTGWALGMKHDHHHNH
ncbi:hypothetical protein [Bacillus phage vB_BanS-Thrax5]|uniref:Uncharacterized protein n=1 Tax=Bacillus phage pW2 TaxID=2500559 RepID=A0A3Q9R7N9_9CAUD|nr:hypothetical protein PQE69_gp018 [Bacillus phage pW2]AZU98871.1 hypothetical protein pW2_32 [Bacillus phage pW2]UUV47039.1 hypothetical protein [Bacillus phage vB_BanS-Thrax5]